MRRLHRLVRLLRDHRGAVALEFVLVFPVLFFIILAVADFGNAIQQSIRLEAAARAGVQYAFTYPRDTTGITNQVLGALDGWSGVTVAPAPDLTCVCPGLSTVSCSNEDVCPVVTERYITVNVQRAYNPLLFGFLTPAVGRVHARLR